MTRPSAVRYPLDVRPYSAPFVNIVRFKNGRPNLRATLKALCRWQSITVRAKNLDQALIRYAVRDARTRIEIRHHPALNTVVVTSLGPSKKKAPQLTRLAHIDPALRAARGPRFQGWKQSLAPTAERHHQ